jgi:hypothetical protein
MDETSTRNRTFCARERHYRAAPPQGALPPCGARSAPPLAEKSRFPPNEDSDEFYRGASGAQYDVFFVETEGNGLVIPLDKERLCAVVNSLPGHSYPSYEQMVAAGIAQLKNRSAEPQIAFQDLIVPEKAAALPSLTLLRLLHSLEHAILTQAEEQIGLQIFGSKILLRDATIVLYEQEHVGEGGILQLVSGNGLSRLLRAVESEVAACNQDCDAGCPACNYVEDAKCRPFVPHEFEGAGVRWLPPNALLGRDLAYRYLADGSTRS